MSDTRALNKALKKAKFPSNFKETLDPLKVNRTVFEHWIDERVSAILGFGDEIVAQTVVNLFIPTVPEDSKKIAEVNPQQAQVTLEGFLGEESAAELCAELWALLLDAQKQEAGIPQKLLEAKKKQLEEKKKQSSNNHHRPQRPPPQRQFDGNHHHRDRRRAISPDRDRRRHQRWDQDDRRRDEGNQRRDGRYDHYDNRNDGRYNDRREEDRRYNERWEDKTREDRRYPDHRDNRDFHRRPPRDSPPRYDDYGRRLRRRSRSRSPRSSRRERSPSSSSSASGSSRSSSSSESSRSRGRSRDERGHRRSR